MEMTLSVVAGTISTIVFATSAMPMLLKAARTRDLRSYSPTNLVLSNVGNAFHTVYVLSLPVGPVWALHAFYLVAAALMLLWYVRYRDRWEQPAPGADAHEMSTP